MPGKPALTSGDSTRPPHALRLWVAGMVLQPPASVSLAAVRARHQPAIGRSPRRRLGQIARIAPSNDAIASGLKWIEFDALNLDRSLPVLAHKLPRTTLGAVAQQRLRQSSRTRFDRARHSHVHWSFQEKGPQRGEPSGASADFYFPKNSDLESRVDARTAGASRAAVVLCEKVGGPSPPGGPRRPRGLPLLY